MPTTVIKTIKSSGGNYTSLSAWEAGEQGDLTGVRDEISVAEDYSFGDTTPLTISGWTTDATRYWKIYTPATERHPGKWDATKQRLESSTTDLYTIDIQDATVNGVLEGLQFRNQYNVTTTPRVILNRATAGTLTVDSCVIRSDASGGATAADGISWDNGGNFKVKNCTIIDYTGNVLTCINIAGTSYVHNNTCINGAVGVKQSLGGTIIARNNVISGCTTAASGTFAAGTDYNTTNNASMGYTVTGGGNTHDKTSQTFIFVDSANKDFHLDTGDGGAKGFGLDLSADADLPVTLDIDGQTRTAPFDMGADQVVGSVAIPGPFIPRWGMAPNRHPLKRRGLRATRQAPTTNDANVIPATNKDDIRSPERFGRSPNHRPMKRRGLRSSISGQKIVGDSQALSANQVIETDIAQPILVIKTKIVGQALETDTAQPISGIKTRVVTQALETDTAQPIGKLKNKTVTQALETDTAQPITALQGGKFIAVNQVIETDTAFPITYIPKGTPVIGPAAPWYTEAWRKKKYKKWPLPPPHFPEELPPVVIEPVDVQPVAATDDRPLWLKVIKKKPVVISRIVKRASLPVEIDLPSAAPVTENKLEVLTIEEITEEWNRIRRRAEEEELVTSLIMQGVL